MHVSSDCPILLQCVFVIVSFKELVHFSQVIKYVGMELFRHPFRVQVTYVEWVVMTPFFILDNGNCISFTFSWLAETGIYQFYQSLKELVSNFVQILFGSFQLHWFLLLSFIINMSFQLPVLDFFALISPKREADVVYIR